MSNLPKVTVTDLLDAGVHFGHNTSRWNPKMAPYIYGARDNVHIINLQQTVPLMEIALKKIYETVKNNGKVLFVGSKVQATDLVAEYAEKCGQFYINSRWLGGTLTNWNTISKSIKKLDTLEKILEDEELADKYTKKEILNFNRKKDKLLKSLAGIRKIAGLPDLIIAIDTNRERLAIEEAKKLNIDVVAVVDTNSNPDNVDYPVPGNDDAIRSIRLYCKLFADAALAGIQDAMTDSGADAGLAEAIVNQDKSLDNVTQIKGQEKLSKAQPQGEVGSKNDKSDDNVKQKKQPKEEVAKPVKKAAVAKSDSVDKKTDSKAVKTTKKVSQSKEETADKTTKATTKSKK